MNVNCRNRIGWIESTVGVAGMGAPSGISAAWPVAVSLSLGVPDKEQRERSVSNGLSFK